MIKLFSQSTRIIPETSRISHRGTGVCGPWRPAHQARNANLTRTLFSDSLFHFPQECRKAKRAKRAKLAKWVKMGFCFFFLRGSCGNSRNSESLLGIEADDRFHMMGRTVPKNYEDNIAQKSKTPTGVCLKLRGNLNSNVKLNLENII